MFSKILKALNDTRGNVAVTFALEGVPLLASMGAGVDFIRANTARERLQSAVDTAVLAGIKQASSSQVSTATQVFNANFDLPWAKNVTPTFTQNGDGSLAAPPRQMFRRRSCDSDRRSPRPAARVELAPT